MKKLMAMVGLAVMVLAPVADVYAAKGGNGGNSGGGSSQGGSAGNSGSSNGGNGSGGAGNSGSGNSGDGVGNGGGGNQGSNGSSAGNTGGSHGGDGGNGGHGGGEGHGGGSYGGGSSVSGGSSDGGASGGPTGVFIGSGNQGVTRYARKGTRFLTPAQEYTWDVFKYCEAQQPALVSLNQLRVDGSFTYNSYIDIAPSNLQRCMEPYGFTFGSPLDDPRPSTTKLYRGDETP